MKPITAHPCVYCPIERDDVFPLLEYDVRKGESGTFEPIGPDTGLLGPFEPVKREGDHSGNVQRLDWISTKSPRHNDQ
eukprot:scaffold1733_cov106-Skeletonema_marinoi.AAC.2